MHVVILYKFNYAVRSTRHAMIEKESLIYSMQIYLLKRHFHCTNL